MMKKRNIKSSVLNGLFVAVLLAIVFVPSAKALVLEGLMQMGLFKPDTEQVAEMPAVSEAMPTALAMRFKDGHGKVVTLADLKGKVVFLNFWATWCPPCLAEMPSINKLYEKYKDDKSVVFIMVDADANVGRAQKYLDKKQYKLPLYVMDSAVPEVIFSGSLPTTVVFDKQGRVSYNGSGAANYNSEKFIEFIEKLKL